MTDKAAISLSFVCTLHCLAFPILLAIVPSLTGIPFLEGEAFHKWLVVAVIPTSIYALTMGCRQHKRYSLFAIGLVGLACLIFAVTLVEPLFEGSGKAEFFEKLFTVMGSLLIAFGHLFNYRQCQKVDECPCPDSSSDESVQQA